MIACAAGGPACETSEFLPCATQTRSAIGPLAAYAAPCRRCGQTRKRPVKASHCDAFDRHAVACPKGPAYFVNQSFGQGEHPSERSEVAPLPPVSRARMVRLAWLPWGRGNLGAEDHEQQRQG